MACIDHRNRGARNFAPSAHAFPSCLRWPAWPSSWRAYVRIRHCRPVPLPRSIHRSVEQSMVHGQVRRTCHCHVVTIAEGWLIGVPILKFELLPGQIGPNQSKDRAVCVTGIPRIFKDKLKSLGTKGMPCFSVYGDGTALWPFPCLWSCSRPCQWFSGAALPVWRGPGCGV